MEELIELLEEVLEEVKEIEVFEKEIKDRLHRLADIQVFPASINIRDQKPFFTKVTDELKFYRLQRLYLSIERGYLRITEVTEEVKITDIGDEELKIVESVLKPHELLKEELAKMSECLYDFLQYVQVKLIDKKINEEKIAKKLGILSSL